ncbi:type II CRISPR RNA-guided endonuclease Cas9 [Limosilactobacillus gorillae]|uniref:type II CRISPR RNA-guided endonuclease Cas9 n=1 Tax=Limosilactobacillus gorillae TaxID=1450649 RepID=UPI000AE646FF|nr:type II CRISPR RNA-guided endonuclease Cas9 [Limosilactobacillus gorillae]
MKEYHVGLDIGTSSIGWAVTDSQFKLMRIKGKTAIGVRLFEEGKTAADRRGFRTTRRRLKRRKWRLHYLNEVFAPHLQEVDENFLRRLKQSNIHPDDPAKNQAFIGKLLFPDLLKKAERGYPTLIKIRDEAPEEERAHYPVTNIYKLREAMINEDRQFDLREVYLAVHHIVKYRGHFLNNASVDKFKVGKIDFAKSFNVLNEAYKELQNGEGSFAIDLDQIDEIGKLLLDTSKKKLDRQKEVAKLLAVKVADKDETKSNKKVATAISKLILGYKANFATDALVDDKANDWKIDLSSETSDDDIEKFSGELNDAQNDILTEITSLFSQLMLNEIVPNGMSISESMMDRYWTHQRQLAEVKKFLATQPSEVRKSFNSLYNQYIGQEPKTKGYDFEKGLKKLLKEMPNWKEIEGQLKAGEFLPKQRTSANGVIPHQMHQQELDRIIEKQAKYYPWLAKKNPATDDRDRHKAKYELDQLVSFRIPYYVGPLVTLKDQERTSGAKFAWAKRRAAGEITPWNLWGKIDRAESAEAFIKRMTVKDTYLLNEDVLPANSLLYQKYNVLNELNNVRVNNHRLSVGMKQDIFNELFESKKTVKASDVASLVMAKTRGVNKPMIEGLSDPKKFNSSLATYLDLKAIIGDKVNDNRYRDDLERIIEWRSVFEDGEIFADKLTEVAWLTDAQRSALGKKRYKGWGRLSKKLLTGLVDENGQRIIDLLWNTDQNFMQIVNQPVFKEQIDQLNQSAIAKEGTTLGDQVESILDDAYTSPQNKKAIWQVVRVVNDITKAVGNAPKSISIEFARNEGNKGERTRSRRNQLRSLFQNQARELVKDTSLLEELENTPDLSDRYYFYFTQGGKDVYTGEPINFDDIPTKRYEIDHILPQSFLKDNSLDNRVLVSQAENSKKSDRVPAKLYATKMRPYWEYLLKQGLITKQKFENLTLDIDQIVKYRSLGFVKRQLVETRQVIKLTADILGSMYRDAGTDIIETRASLTKQLREEFDLPKVREVNDYHHAVDAYLTTFAGQFLTRRYPKLRSFFVYGEYMKFTKGTDLNLRNFDFFHELVKDKHEKNNEDKKVYDDRGMLIISRSSLANYLNQIIRMKIMRVTKEIRIENGMLYKATINSTKNLGNVNIPLKKEMPVDLYGSYLSKETSFMSLIRIKGQRTARIVRVPVDALSKLSKYEKHSKEYLDELYKTIKNNNNIINDFIIILPQLGFNQLILDKVGGERVSYRLGGYDTKHLATELVLKKETLKKINNNFSEIKKSDNPSQEFDELFDEIIKTSAKYLPLLRKKILKIESNRRKFYEADVVKKERELNNILAAIHANNGTRHDLKTLNVSEFGRIRCAITLTKDAEVVFESPTGLFIRRLKISNI